MAFTKNNLISLFKVAVQHRASDVHVRSNEQPVLRIRGELVPIQSKPLTAEDVEDVVKLCVPKLVADPNYHNIKEHDAGFHIPSLCRVRINFFRYDDKVGLIFRIISEQITSLKDLRFPKILEKIAEKQRGMILVTGATGSGKSTTLAAMINHINNTRKAHIVTIEDPIEFMHPQINCRISQREVGKDTDSFKDALRASLRQDPDVIFIGELRDPETVQIALKAAETGHVVFSTVHTTNVMATIGRLLSMFPPEQQGDVRERLAVNLEAVISQRILKRVDGQGIAVAQEIMNTNPGVRECIMGEEPLERIIQIMKDGAKAGGGSGMKTFDQDIMRMFEEGSISKNTALAAASNGADFLTQLEFEG